MAFYKKSHLILMVFASLLIGMHPSMSKSALDVFSPYSLTFFQLLFSTCFAFFIVLITYLMNDKAFDNFLSNYSIIFKKLPFIFFSSIGSTLLPTLTMNLAIYHSHTIVIGLLMPLIPFFTNIVNRFGPSKEHLPQRKIAGIVFCILGIICSYYLYLDNAYKQSKLNESLKSLIIVMASEFVFAIMQRFNHDSLSECDFYFTPFVENLIALFLSFLCIFAHDGRDGVQSLFSVTKKQLIAPALSGILELGLVIYISAYLFSIIGFPASALIFYAASFVSFLFGSISLNEINAFDLPIIFSFIIGLLNQSFAMILEYQTPIFLNRKEERAKAMNKNMGSSFRESPVIPYSPFSQESQFIPDIGDQID